MVRKQQFKDILYSYPSFLVIYALILDVKFLINSQYTNKVDKILTLNTIRQANTVPVSRMLFKPFFLIFSSFDDYWLYSYH